MKLTFKQLSLAIASVGMLTLYGCGGGSSDSATSPPATPTTSTKPVTTDATVSLPVALLSRPQASSCSALRTGNYLFATPDKSGKLDEQAHNVYINAETLKISEASDPATSTLVPSVIVDEIPATNPRSSVGANTLRYASCTVWV